MAQPTVTRKELRQRIGILLQEPFLARFAGEGTADSGSASTLIDAAFLTQKDDYWVNAWLYIITGDNAGEVRRISDFVQSTSTISVESGFTNGIAVGDTYEIWDVFNPLLINETINWAIRNAWPYFFDVSEEEMVIREAPLGNRYQLQSILTNTPRFLHQVWHERPASTITGTATAGTANTLSDSTNSPFVNGTHDDGGWWVRIYEGTGAGQIRLVSAVGSTSQITVSANWTTNPDTTSKYRLVNRGDGLMSYEFFNSWTVDRPEWPTLWIPNGHPYGYEGYVWRLIFSHLFTELTDDTTTTECPEDYIVHYVLAQIYKLKQASAPSSESRNWAILQTQAAQELESYIEKNHYRFPESTIMDAGAPARRYASDYPFRGA